MSEYNTAVNIETFESRLLREKYYRYIHESGLQIFVFPKKMSSTYALFGTRYGSVDNVFRTAEDRDFITVPDGIAHFLEHKLFANEDGSDSFERFSDFGADANAYTSFNKTAYVFSCTDNLEASLGELIDFVTHPYFTPASVEKERGIIGEEIRMYDDSPADRCFYGMLEGMYEKHSIRRNICGSAASIARITDKTLYECYRVFYNLSNMALVVCGDVDPENIIKIAQKHLPSAGAPTVIVRSDENSAERPTVFKSYVEQKMQVSKPMFNIGIKDTDIPYDPRQRQKKDAAMAILDEMIFARSGEFYNSLFESELISPGLSYGYTMSSVCAYNSVAGEAEEPEKVLGELKKYISELRLKGLKRSDFERGKRVMYAEFVKTFDSTESIANTLFSFFCEGGELLGYADVINEVTFDDVCRLFQNSFDDKSYTLSVIVPV